jgi:hypothetical protein
MACCYKFFLVSYNPPVPPTGRLTALHGMLSHLEDADNVRKGRGLPDDSPEAPVLGHVLRLSPLLGWEAKELKGAAALRPPGHSGQAVSGPLPMSSKNCGMTTQKRYPPPCPRYASVRKKCGPNAVFALDKGGEYLNKRLKKFAAQSGSGPKAAVLQRARLFNRG